MSINSIQGGISMIQPLPQSGKVRRNSAAGDGDGDGSRAGGLASAINQSLARMGVNGASSQNSQQALSAFMQSLLAALQSQNGQGAAHHHGHHHGGGIQAGLQNLIQALSSPGASSNSSSALQQSFQNLLNANGASGNQATLAGFLQTLSQNLQASSLSGNVVNTLG